MRSSASCAPRATPSTRCACSPSPTPRAPSAPRRSSPPSPRRQAASPTMPAPTTSKRSTRASARSSDGGDSELAEVPMSTPSKPYSRQEYAGALAANAAANKFNLALFVGTMGAGVLVGGPVILTLLVACAVYALGCARTFFNSDEADKVLARVRAERRRAIERGETRVDISTLSGDIGAPLRLAREREQLIRDAIERAELPYDEVS